MTPPDPSPPPQISREADKMKNGKTLRARRTPKVTRTDSPTAPKRRKRPGATVPLSRADRFVVGYRSRGNIVFGAESRSDRWDGYKDAAQPMTLRQAQRFLTTLPSNGGVIFELVPIQPSDVKRGE